MLEYINFKPDVMTLSIALFSSLFMIGFILLMGKIINKEQKKEEKKEQKEEKLTEIQKELKKEINATKAAMNIRDNELKERREIREAETTEAEIKQIIPEKTNITNVKDNKESFTNASKEQGSGWWSDVTKCQANGNNKLYCKKEDKWLFPY